MCYNKVIKRLEILNKKKLYFVNKKVLDISEKQSRDWRFRCLSRIYLANSYKLLFTGHSATDRAETALLQLIRGTSLQGMTNFKLSKNYKWVYPKYYNYSNFF